MTLQECALGMRGCEGEATTWVADEHNGAQINCCHSCQVAWEWRHSPDYEQALYDAHIDRKLDELKGK